MTESDIDDHTTTYGGNLITDNKLDTLLAMYRVTLLLVHYNFGL